MGRRQEAPVSQGNTLMHIEGRDGNHGRIERRRLQVERVVSGLRFRCRHAAVHQFRQHFGRIHRVDNRVRLEIPQLVGARSPCINARTADASNTGLWALFGIHAPPPPPLGDQPSDRFTPSGMYLRSSALARRSPCSLVSTTNAPLLGYGDAQTWSNGPLPLSSATS